MAEIIQSQMQPELFFGLVGPIGTNVTACIDALEKKLVELQYKVVKIKITDLFPALASESSIPSDLKQSPLEDRYNSYIDFGDNLREHFDDDSILASCFVQKIRNARPTPEGGLGATAYILDQFKRRDELELLRSIYGPLFFQISVYSKRSSRVDNLARKIAISHNSADSNRFREESEQLVRRDENEIDDDHGQRVSEVFHEADFIVNTDLPELSSGAQIERLIHLIFGSNSISPTKREYGLYTAKSASLRSVDLSRQVGAAIFTDSGEIITLGANEVPKAGGGTYWCDEGFDNRDFRRNEDSNDRRKKELLTEVALAIYPRSNIDRLFEKAQIKNSQFMDALEYGRVIHAEMSAISDAARLGRALKDTTLFCTTFPCHMCTKHIVASGIKEVIFLEPYPKSLAGELHGDSVEIEGQTRGDYSSFSSCKFQHFYGVSPRRYREFFESKKKRKTADGKFLPWRSKQPQPIVDIKLPTYLFLETHILEGVLWPALAKAHISLQVFESQTPHKRALKRVRSTRKRGGDS